MKNKFIATIFFTFLLFVSFVQADNSIRVLVVQETISSNLTVRGSYEIINPVSGRTLFRGNSIRTTVAVSKNGFLLGPVKSDSEKVLIKPAEDEEISLDGRTYKGAIEFIKKDNGSMEVVNDIGLEDYIKGILYHEASHYWPLEALKAQAVACRTYAIYQSQLNSKKDFDLTNDIYSQVYGGMTSERARTSKAVDDTAGLVLTYRGKIFPAYFHATCAGYTEDAGQLWNINLPPLKGVECGFCAESPHYSWHEVLSLDEISQKLSKAGFKVDDIQLISVKDRDMSKRAVNLRIASGKKEFDIPAKDFRNIIGPNIIRSTNFNVTITDKDAVFEGLGWGHGVGLCQWGAYFMAKKGKNFREILEYYYPGAQIETFRF